MPTPQEIRKIRLANDYKQMCNIRGSIISWVVTEGSEPYVEEYKLTVHVRTITGVGSGNAPSGLPCTATQSGDALIASTLPPKLVASEELVLWFMEPGRGVGRSCDQNG